jgi:(p)ppGpp synthase/HD superfamily hydrolase
MPTPYSLDLFDQALLFAAAAHKGQKIKGSRMPYIIHPVMVAMEIITRLDQIAGEDPDLLVQSTLLHDVLEDTRVTPTELELNFGADVSKVVLLLSKKIRAERNQEKSMKEYLGDLAGGPKSAQIIKMADRIVNLNPPPKNWKPKKIANYFEESKEIYQLLHPANPALAKRLNEKMEFYQANYLLGSSWQQSIN